MLVIAHIFFASALKQRTGLFPSAAICTVELSEGAGKASRQGMGNHQLSVS
jgi:hypothetical protein